MLQLPQPRGMPWFCTERGREVSLLLACGRTAQQNVIAQCHGAFLGALLGALLGAVPLGAWPWDALTEGDAAGGHATPLVKRALSKAFVAVCSVCEPCAVTAAALWLHSLTAHLRASCVGCNAYSRIAAPATPAFRFPFSLRAKPEFIN